MLGKSIADPDGVEEGGTIRGMGLLDADTVFEAEKARTRIEGRVLNPDGILKPLAGAKVTGYEIHMGRTHVSSETMPFTEIVDTITGEHKIEGACGNNVYGSYIHGIFDNQEIAVKMVRAIAASKGITEEMDMEIDFAAFKETQYDLLADGLRKHLDMEEIYKILDGETDK